MKRLHGFSPVFWGMHSRRAPRAVLIAVAAGLGMSLSAWTLMSPAGTVGWSAASAPLDPAPTIAPDPVEHACLALTLYWEAKNEGRNGMIAVAWVVLNRRSHPDFPKRICEVVRQGGERPGCQFSYWCDGKGDAPRAQDLWTLAEDVARETLLHPPPDPTAGALFFHSTLLASVPWHGQGGRTRTGQIGRHVYYR